MENTISKIQCSSCGKYFVGITIHEMHRVGTFETNMSRKCLTTDEMKNIGMDTEIKNVKTIINGVTTYEEHDVWFHTQTRERARKYFSTEQE